MATKANLYKDLVDSLLRGNSGIGAAKQLSLPPSITAGHTSDQNSRTVTARTGAGNDLRITSPIANAGAARSIQFGKPSQEIKPAAATSKAAWPQLVEQAAQKGVASLLGGGLGTLGLGTIVSGILSLFGSGNKKTAIPLVRFNLSESQNNTLYIGGGTLSSSAHTGSRAPQYGSSASAGPMAAVRSASPARTQTVAKGSATATSATPISAAPISVAQGETLNPNVDSQWFVDRSSDIAKAVKEAMLNSHALNDVISEI